MLKALLCALGVFIALSVPANAQRSTTVCEETVLGCICDEIPGSGGGGGGLGSALGGGISGGGGGGGGLFGAIVEDIEEEWDALEEEVDNAVPYVADGIYNCIKNIINSIASIGYSMISPAAILRALLNKLVNAVCAKAWELVRETGIYDLKREIEDVINAPVNSLPPWVPRTGGTIQLPKAALPEGKPSDWMNGVLQ